MRYDDEPVFRRSKWGTNRYYYNPNNPIGLALIVITLVFTATMVILIVNRAGPFKRETANTPWSPPLYTHSWPPPSSAPTPWPT
ncbi:hypothetical protein OG444_31960 [Streptomyces sp. NBC_01232]|uniref:hypothetical protein n=1 Tax=Streptomyces TaxID=1883 RepID=UPI00207A02F2|nr:MULTISPECIES: hypothetical protein [Streptomyces]MCM9083085.1 hypothetical protein [Streptomyces spororaveus]MCX4717192.1 hypothetical protein [Streptomyces virginiae]MCX4806964.1 hypothetical protein [Streptomyces sp. NBC_01214]WSQ01870.1 hypothetical protein OG444_31960 [Streptomyces sp. NBC_01232]